MKLVNKISLLGVALAAAVPAMADTPPTLDTSGLSTWEAWVVAGLAAIFAIKIGPKAAVWAYRMLGSFFGGR